MQKAISALVLFRAEIFVRSLPAAARCAVKKRALSQKRERKLRSGINWQVTLKKGVKQKGLKRGLLIFYGLPIFFRW